MAGIVSKLERNAAAGVGRRKKSCRMPAVLRRTGGPFENSGSPSRKVGLTPARCSASELPAGDPPVSRARSHVCPGRFIGLGRLPDSVAYAKSAETDARRFPPLGPERGRGNDEKAVGGSRHRDVHVILRDRATGNGPGLGRCALRDGYFPNRRLRGADLGTAITQKIHILRRPVQLPVPTRTT